MAKRLPKGVLPKDDPWREVTALFPKGTPVLTPEQRSLYSGVLQEHGPYVFAVDRQSDKEELRRLGHSGQIRRVEAITHFAGQAGWLPPPVYRQDREEGDLAYDFDGVRDFWFLDGENQNATGYAASHYARPEFWRAYDLAEALAKEKIGPAAFVIGEGTRFFRDTTWMHTFCRGLWDARVRVFIANFGEVTQQTFPGLAAMINALSSWLPEVGRGYKEACRRDERLAHRRLWFGLEPSPDGKAVYATSQWAILREMVFRLADLSLPSLNYAKEWLWTEHGIRRSHDWIHQLLFDHPILEGYYLSHRNRCEPRRVRQRPHSDLDITPNGNKRYLVRPTENPLLTPIDFEKYGQEPIPPHILSRARKAVASRRRPTTNPPQEGSLLSGFYTRCAVCGHAIQERQRCRPRPIWQLRCMCANTLRMAHTKRTGITMKLTTAEQLPECQHERYRSLGEVSLSSRVWDLLTDAIERYPFRPENRQNDPALHEEEERVKVKIADLTDRIACAVAALGEGMPAAVVAAHNKQLREWGAAVEAEERRLNTLTARRIERHQQEAALCQYQEAMSAYMPDMTDDQKARFLRDIIERIDVHLAEGWFRVTATFHLPVLEGWFGAEEGNGETSASWTDSLSFTVTLQGSFDA
jgi:hypothetical protein